MVDRKRALWGSAKQLLGRCPRWFLVYIYDDIEFRFFASKSRTSLPISVPLMFMSYVNSNAVNKNETIAVLCEALLHFMLTVCTLPSERKIQVKDNPTIDVVIPNLQSLKRTPDKSIIIEIIRNKMDSDKILQLEFLQPNHKNIWLISAIPFSTTRYRIYAMPTNTGLSHNSFSNVIKDINNFLKETGDKSLRFVH